MQIIYIYIDTFCKYSRKIVKKLIWSISVKNCCLLFYMAKNLVSVFLFVSPL